MCVCVCVCVCFVDLEKAVDNLDLWDILNISLENYVPNEIILLIKDIYSNNFSRIKIQNEPTEKKFAITRGIRQGDSLSPLLFSIVMDKTLSYVKHLQGYRMGSEEINIVCYADDIALITDTEDDLKRLLYNFHLSFLKFSMKISIHKTKAMTISKEPLRCKLEMTAEWESKL